MEDLFAIQDEDAIVASIVKGLVPALMAQGQAGAPVRRPTDNLEERASRGEEIARLYKLLHQSDTPEFMRAAV